MRKRNPRGFPKLVCSKCKKELEANRVGKQRYCLRCHANHMNATRKKYSEYSEDEKLRSNCRSYLNVYVRRGSVVKKPCAVCGELKVQAHHSDYKKPLEVTWLCRKHHNEIHKL